MSTFDVNNQYNGTYFGKDRLGFTTPDPDATEILRPFLCVPYPAPWLPGRRRDEGHPVGAQVVLSAGYAVGQDKNGALIPAGMKSGNTGAGGDYVMVVYSSDDVGMAFNAVKGTLVAAANEYALIAASSDYGTAVTVTGTILTGSKSTLTVAGADKAKVVVGSYVTVAGMAGVRRVIAKSGDDCTLDSASDAAVGAGAAVAFGKPTISGITPTDAEVTAAKAIDLIPGGVARGIGYAIRNVFQFLGGVTVSSATGGMNYTLNGIIPTKYRVHNYMHEPGTAIQTSFGLRVPFIGADLNTLNTRAAAAGLTAGEYSYDDFSRSFVHFCGTIGNASGQLYRGCSVVADDLDGALGTGHYRPFDPAKHSADQIIGRVIGIESMYPIHDYADRVRTQFDRAQSFVGPFADRNPTTQMMAGSATRGMDYAINLSTKGLLRSLLQKGVAPANIPVEAGTYIWFGLRTI